MEGGNVDLEGGSGVANGVSTTTSSHATNNIARPSTGEVVVQGSAVVKEDLTRQLHKYLLLLAILVATVTYVAGMDPPGGVWLETKDGHRTGNPILPATRRVRYTLFYYFNATAFAASLVIIILLLFIKHGDEAKKKVAAVRIFMVLDVLCLMVAYVAGSCRGRLTTIYASALCAAVVLLIVVLNSFAQREMKKLLTWLGMKKLLTWLRILKSSGEEGGIPENGHSQQQQQQQQVPNMLWEKKKLRRKERRKVLMLLAMFVTTITYTAALNPPGGFWEEAPEEHDASHRAGDPILLERHTKRFLAFLICNTTSFAASLVIITLLLSTRMWRNVESEVGLYGGVAVALLGLMGAYAAGSARETDTTIYVLCLVGVVLLYIAALAGFELRSSDWFTLCNGSASDRTIAQEESHNDNVTTRSSAGSLPVDGQVAPPGSTTLEPDAGNASRNKVSESEEAVEKARSLILLLATLAVTVTYQAGLNPPGGVWRDTGDGHVGGNLILLATHARRYKVFFYCNSAAFVTSIVVVIMVQSTGKVSARALQAAVILDLFGLMGAYAAGSCRDVLTSVYVFILAAVVFAAVVIHAVIGIVKSSTVRMPLFLTSLSRQVSDLWRKIWSCLPSPPPPPPHTQDKENEKKRKLLLLLAILAVSITYQAGLTPPGKFWLEHGDAAHHVGDPVLADNYPRRYKAFFYCNATSFMVSVAVIVVLVGRKLSDADRKYWWLLYGSMGAGLIGLMGAYAAGTTRRVKTSIYVFALVGAVLLFAVLRNVGALEKCIGGIGKKLVEWIPCQCTEDVAEYEPAITKDYRKQYRMKKYLLLLGILAASITYQAGLDPPGGVWPSDGDGHEAGDPVLHDESRRRYHAFFYSNSTCFVTSVVVIVLLLQSTLIDRTDVWPMRAMHMAVVLDLLGLLAAYATGGSRDWGTFGYVLAMAVTVLAYVAIYMALSYDKGEEEPQIGTNSGSNGSSNRPELSAGR